MRKPDWWLRLKASIENNKVYALFFGEPMRCAPNGAYLLYCFAIFFGSLAFIISSNFIQDYITLDQMNRQEVIIIEATYSDRKSGDEAWLSFELSNGVKKKYDIPSAHKDLVLRINKYRGEKATIWIDHVYRHIDSYYLIRELKVDEKTLIRYRYRTPGEVDKANKNGDVWSLWLFILSVFLSTAIVAYIALVVGKNKSKYTKNR